MSISGGLLRLIDPEVFGFAVFAGFVSGYSPLDATDLFVPPPNGLKSNTANTAKPAKL